MGDTWTYFAKLSIFSSHWWGHWTITHIVSLKTIMLNFQLIYRNQQHLQKLVTLNILWMGILTPNIWRKAGPKETLIKWDEMPLLKKQLKLKISGVAWSNWKSNPHGNMAKSMNTYQKDLKMQILKELMRLLPCHT